MPPCGGLGYQIDFALPSPPPRVSILVPTTGERSLLEPCVNSLLRCIIWTPAVELVHREFASLGRHDAPERTARFSQDVAWMRARWGPVLDDDPFYNPNLSLARPHELAYPPRPRREPS